MRNSHLFNLVFFVFMLCFSAVSVNALDALSVSNVNFIEDDNKLDNAFLVTVVDGFDKSGTIRASEVSDDNIEATKDIDIYIDDQEYTCEYSFLDKSNEYIRTYRFHEDRTWTRNGCYDLSTSSNEEIVGYYSRPIDIKYRCIVAEKIYNVGVVSSPQENFKLRLKADNGEDEISSDFVSSEGVTSRYLYDGNEEKAYIKWSGGGLKTNEQCPRASDEQYIAIQNVGRSNTFRMIDESELDAYKVLFREYKNSVEGTTGAGNYLSSIEDKMDEIDFHVSNLVFKDELRGSTGESYELKDISNSRKTIELEDPFTLPVFTLKVNADYVGVKYPKGIPKILNKDVLDLQLKSGKGKSLEFEIKNIGNGDATFRSYVECTDEIFSETKNTQIDAGDTEEVKLFMNSNTVEEIKSDCELVVFDINDENRKDMADFEVKTNPFLKFNDGHRTCVGNKLIEYNNNQPETLEVCEYGCEVIGDGEAKCKEGDNNDKGGDDEYDSNFSFILLMVSGLFGLFTVFVVYNFMSFLESFKYKKIEIGNIIRLSISIVLGLIVFVLVPITANFVIGLFSLPKLF